MKWSPLHLRRQVHISSYMFKVIKGESPNNFINKFKYISGSSRDGSNCNLYTPKSQNLKNFYYLGAKAWKNLPSDLRNKCDTKAFSNIYKGQLLHSIIGDPTYHSGPGCRHVRVWVKILNSFSFVLTCKLNKKLIHCKKPKLN